MRTLIKLLRRFLLCVVMMSATLYILTMTNVELKHQRKRLFRTERIHNEQFVPVNSTKLDELKVAQADENDDLPIDNRFKELLAKYAINNVITLAVTDFGYIEMAHNLYESSFKRFNISNYLFVCSHEKAEQYLLSRDIHAISLWNDSLSTEESLYSRKGYRNKTNFKTDSVYMALSLGYTTFLVDVDVVFLQNPLPHLIGLSTDYDLIIQDGYLTLNSGE